VVRHINLDCFLLDVPVQVYCQESGVGLDCSFFSFNKKLIEHKVVKDLEGLARLSEEIVNMRYSACQGMEERDLFGTVHNFTFHQDILIENYKGQMVFRSRNCDFVMKNMTSKCCENCFSLRIVLQKHIEAEHETELTLTIQELGEGCPSNDRSTQKVLVTSQDSRLLDTAISYSIPELKIPSFSGPLDTFSAEEDALTIVDSTSGVKKLKLKKKSRGRPIVQTHSCPGRECNKRFSNLTALKRHQKDEHLLEFRCSWDGSSCSKAFLTESELKNHEKIHSGELPFQCNLCEHRFLKIKSLNSHKKVHLGIKPHVCDICEKAFIRKDQLQVHRSVHSGEKSFLCGTCGTSYTRQTHLIEHNKRVHVGEKRFACKDCDKAFFSPQQLQRHARVHNGEKPYECSVCKRKFSRSHHLKIHIKRLHSVDEKSAKPPKPSLESFLNGPSLVSICEPTLSTASLVPSMFS